MRRLCQQRKIPLLSSIFNAMLQLMFVDIKDWCVSIELERLEKHVILLGVSHDF